MHKVFSLKIGWAVVLFATLDLFCVGLGMGLPIFCILFGFPVGWYLARRLTTRWPDVQQVLAKVLLGAALTSGFTLLLMALLWGRSIPLLFGPAADVANFGIPLILYEPKASLIGWLALMIVISPFLQFLMMLFGSHVTLLWVLSRRGMSAEEDNDHEQRYGERGAV